jgi:uncharacterized protein YkwD
MQHSFVTRFRHLTALALGIALIASIWPTPISYADTLTPTPPAMDPHIQADTFTTYLAIVLTSPPAPSCISENRDYEIRVMALINVERQKNGLPALVEHPALTLATCRHSRDMADNHFLSHTGSDGSLAEERMSAAGYPGSYAGEIAGADGGGSPENRVASWMSSSKHRDILLSSTASEFGVGYATTTPTAQAPWTAYWTVDFGSR